ncbi:MAG: hypothetical protein N2506_01395 [Dehalococcoidales bacterium]|nr:hypothetical protein [Dehalococcoidales bacterium]
MKLSLQASATPRINLFFVAIFLKIIASALSGIGFVLTSPWYYVSGTVVWLIFFFGIFVFAFPQADGWLSGFQHWLRPAARTIIVVFVIIGLVMLLVGLTVGLGQLASYDRGSDFSRLMDSLNRVFGYNDATALCHQAAENLLQGKNPYVEANVVSAMLRFQGATDKLTPLREGRFADSFPYPSAEELERLWQEAAQDPGHIPVEVESKFNYPAGSFLLPAPFIWLGVRDMRIIYLILLLPALCCVAAKVPRGYRTVFVFALIASLELWNSLAAGETGFLYFPFLLLAWVLYPRHRITSAICMAIAVATKQIAWFLLPFYLILILRTDGFRRLLLAAGTIGGIFVAANIWFFARDPVLWLNSIFAPVLGRLFPLGVGIITIVTGGLVDIRSPLVFSILEYVIFAGGIVWYWFSCRRYPNSALVLGILPLFFAWRSLWSYFFYVDIIMLAGVLVNEYGKAGGDDTRQETSYFQVHQVLTR